MLKGVLPKDYALPGLDKQRLGQLINLVKLDAATCLRQGFGRQVSANLLVRRSASKGGRRLAVARKPAREQEETRLTRSRARPEASFPIAPAKAALPQEYAEALAAIKTRIQQERLRVVLSANAAMILLYWDIGRTILDRQERAGWGAKVIDRLAADLCESFPDMKGFSPRNLKYMRAFAVAWPERAIVQEPLAQTLVPPHLEN